METNLDFIIAKVDFKLNISQGRDIFLYTTQTALIKFTDNFRQRIDIEN